MIVTQNPNKGRFTGFYDTNNKPIHEGDMVRFRNFRAIIIYNEFKNNWTHIHVAAYNDMKRNPYCRNMYLADDDSCLNDCIIKCWNMQVINNIYKDPSQLSDNSLLAYLN